MTTDDSTPGRISTCTACGGANLTDGTTDLERAFGPFRYVQSVRVQRCERCDEWVAWGPDVAAFDDAVTRLLVDQGVAYASALVRLRKTAGLRVEHLADLLGVDPAAVEAWEQGRALIDRAHLLTLGALALDVLDGSTTTRDRLHAAAHTQPGTTRVRAA